MFDLVLPVCNCMQHNGDDPLESYKEAKFAVSLNELKNWAFWIIGTSGDELWAFQYDIWLKRMSTSCLTVKTVVIVFFQHERYYVVHISSSSANTHLVVRQTCGARKGKSASYKTVMWLFDWVLNYDASPHWALSVKLFWPRSTSQYENISPVHQTSLLVTLFCFLN